MENQPKISVITVTYNVEDIVEKTIQSVLNQTYKNIEYIIIDGLSKDRTMEIVERYRPQLAGAWSERDKNLYDAMNKGLARATGDYVWFMNAGDLIHEPTTLETALAQANNADFIYGKVQIHTADGQTPAWHKPHPDPKTLNFKSFRQGMLISHQSMIVRRALCEPYRHELYPLVADLDWVLRIFKKNPTVHDSGIFLSSMLEGGISAQRRRASWNERFGILRAHFGLLPTLWQHFLFVVGAMRRGSLGSN